MPKRKQTNSWRDRNPEKYRELRKVYDRKYKANNRDKVNAGMKVLRAVRSGRLVKKPCVVCGDANAHGHHEDYSKPLIVIWFCDKHHKEHHRRLNDVRVK